jgi:hypothetical protein
VIQAKKLHTHITHSAPLGRILSPTLSLSLSCLLLTAFTKAFRISLQCLLHFSSLVYFLLAIRMFDAVSARVSCLCIRYLHRRFRTFSPLLRALLFKLKCTRFVDKTGVVRPPSSFDSCSHHLHHHHLCILPLPFRRLPPLSRLDISSSVALWARNCRSLLCLIRYLLLLRA